MRWTLALALPTLLSVALAGCLAPGGALDPSDAPGAVLPPGTLACIDGVCNFQATVDPPDRAANELSLAVNPLDPLNIIATGKDYTPMHAGDCVWDAVYVTKDGGASWTNIQLPGSPGLRMAGDLDAWASPFAKYWCATDPVVAFGGDGTAYWTVMPYQCDPVSGSKVGREFVPGTGIGLPMGGMNDWAFTCSSMWVLASDDGGLTWPRVRMVAEGPFISHDKQWIAASPHGDVAVLCWDYRDALVYPGGMVTGGIGGTQEVLCARTEDRGATWTEPHSAGHAGVYPWIEFGPDGEVYMALVDGFLEGNVLVGRSDDGLAWGEFHTVAPFKNSEHQNVYGWPALRGSQARLIPAPSLAVDRSDGPTRGSVYVTFFDHSTGDGNVLVAASRDGGETWSAPVRPHDDGASPNDQFYPTVSVGPDGTVDVSWLDRRDDPDNYLIHAYHAYSRDGGATWSQNLRVSEVASDEAHSHHQNGMVFLGDYRDSDSTEAGVTMLWVDTRHGKADVYVATVQR